MNIACWNCHNLNSNPNQKNRVNCSNYLGDLQTKFYEGTKEYLDVIFLSEVEDKFDDVSSDLTKFVPCSRLDQGWAWMSSGILLYHTRDVSLDPLGDPIEQILLIPRKKDSDPDSKYGFAIKANLKKGNESVDAVFFWNTKRKNAPSHGPVATFNLLLDRLMESNFFAAKSWFIAGDFNLTYDEVDSRCRKKIRNGYSLQGRTNTYFRSFRNQNYCSDLDHLVSSSGTAEMISFNGLSQSDFVGKGHSDHLPIIFKTR